MLFAFDFSANNWFWMLPAATKLSAGRNKVTHFLNFTRHLFHLTKLFLFSSSQLITFKAQMSVIFAGFFVIFHGGRVRLLSFVRAENMA